MKQQPNCCSHRRQREKLELALTVAKAILVLIQLVTAAYVLMSSWF